MLNVVEVGVGHCTGNAEDVQDCSELNVVGGGLKTGVVSIQGV